MPFLALLDAGRIAVPALARSATRDDVIACAADMLAAPSGIPAERIRDGLARREAMASTAIGAGIALPHARMASPRDEVGAFLKLPRPVDFQAPDHAGVDLVLAMVVSEDRVQAHLHRLSAIVERLSDPAFCASLRDARDATALARLLLAPAPGETIA